MIVLLGAAIVVFSVWGGFMMAGGNTMALMHLSELIIIGGAALGSLILMSPKKVLIDLLKQAFGALKGSPYSRKAYDELFKALYELFMLGRRGGMVALEEHIMSPDTSSIFAKYPVFQKNKHALEFLCNGLRPIIDGKIKPDHLKLLLEIELDAMEAEHERPIAVLVKAADAMPGFGIVAAVLGIVITMLDGRTRLGKEVAAELRRHAGVWHCGRRAGHCHHHGLHRRPARTDWRKSGCRPRRHVPGHFHLLRVHEPNGGQYGIHQCRGIGLYPLHRGVGRKFCQRDVPRDGRGSGPAGPLQGSQTQRRSLGIHAQGDRSSRDQMSTKP